MRGGPASFGNNQTSQASEKKCGQIGPIDSNGEFSAIPAPSRFWAKVDIRGPNECWEWTGSRHEKGYGHFWENNKITRAHRKSWEMVNGRQVPRRKQILHSCDNPPCVNPAHLLHGTPAENARDWVERGRYRKQPR